MTIQLNDTKPLQYLMYFIIIVQECVSFNVFPFLLPLSLTWQLMSSLVFMYQLIVFLHRPRLSLFDCLVIIYMFLLVSFTLINGTDIRNAFYRSCNVISILLMMRNYPDHRDLMLKASMLSFSFCVYANMFLMILFPDWMIYTQDGRAGFLLGGNYNSIGCRMLPCLIVCVLYSLFDKRWLVNTVLLSAISILTLVVVGSMTSTSGIILFLLLCFVPILQIRKAAIAGIFISVLLVQFFVVFAGESIKDNDLLVYFIEDVLNKDITFTYRTNMWDAAAKIVEKSPIIGWGYVDADWFKANMSSFAIGPHNYIYSVLIFGGGTLLTLFTWIVLLAIKAVWFDFTKFSSTILIGISVFFIMMLMEMYPFFFVLYLLTVAYYSREIEDSLTAKKVLLKANRNHIQKKQTT